MYKVVEKKFNNYDEERYGPALVCLEDEHGGQSVIRVDDITCIQQVKTGVEQWLAGKGDAVTSEFRESYRGEMIIRKVTS